MKRVIPVFSRVSSLQFAEVVPPGERPRLRAEIFIVLGLSLGLSAVYSIIQIIDLSTRSVPLSQQSTSLNTAQSSRQVFDFLYQVVGILGDLVPVALVGYLLWRVARPHLGALGIDGRRPLADSGWGVALALVIGIPGILVYILGRQLGLTVNVVASGGDTYWWSIPVLLLSAARSGLQEEVIMIGYLYYRLNQLGWGRWKIIVFSALIRGSYHLYQGWGAFVGNLAMGIFFGWLYTRYGRLLPFVIAHFVIDAAIFVGYPWAAATFLSGL